MVNSTVSLTNAKPIVAPLIRVRLLGARYDPQGAVTPKFGSKVHIPEPIKKGDTGMKINDQEYKDHSIRVTGVDGGVPLFTLERKENTLMDKLGEDINTVRSPTTQGAGIGKNLDFFA